MSTVASPASSSTAVENHLDAAAHIAHGLAARRGQIDNGKPAVGEPDAAVVGPPFARIVGSTMPQGIQSGDQPAPIGGRALRGSSYDAAHGGRRAKVPRLCATRCVLCEGSGAS